MCWEQSPLKRTIATSRSDDNRGECDKAPAGTIDWPELQMDKNNQ
jgi:hypothetical protein